MQDTLQKILALHAELESLRPLSADQEQRIWQKFRLDWNYHSNHLEGNSLTYGETKSLLLHNITAQGKPLKDHLEITGHNEAILEIIDAVKQQRPLTESFLRSLHTLILKERYQVDAQTADGQPTKKWIEVGQYKTLPNHVQTVTGELFRFAEPFEVPAKMQALVAQANEKHTGVIEGLLHAAKLHYEFVLIHPFDDGNGRMARILMNLVLMQNSLPPAIIKTEAKEEYFSALRQADGGQFEVFAGYIAARLVESLQVMVAGARGENIDSPDDLDKKIALFAGLVKENRGDLPVSKTPNLVEKFLDGLFCDLLKEIDIKNKKFDTFYVSNTQRVINVFRTLPSKESVSFSQFLNDVKVRRSKFSNPSSIRLYISFESLKLTPHNTKNYSFSIFFDFDLLGVNVSLNRERYVSILAYNANENAAFINQIIDYYTKHHLNWLQNESGIRLPD